MKAMKTEVPEGMDEVTLVIKKNEKSGKPTLQDLLPSIWCHVELQVFADYRYQFDRNIAGSESTVTRNPAPVGLPADAIPPRSPQMALPRSRGSLSHNRGRNNATTAAAKNVPPASRSVCDWKRRNGPHDSFRYPAR